MKLKKKLKNIFILTFFLVISNNLIINIAYSNENKNNNKEQDQIKQNMIDRMSINTYYCILDTVCASNLALDSQTIGGALSVIEIYNKYCSSCHKSGIANAPIFGKESDWTERIAKGKAELVKNAINGYNAMPAKGTCMSCTEEEISLTVEYLAGLDENVEKFSEGIEELNNTN